MPTLYKIEIFNRAIEFKSFTPFSPKLFYFDYLTLKKTQLEIPKIDVAKGDFAHVTDLTGKEVYQGIVDDVIVSQSICKISLVPLLSLYDIVVYFNRADLMTGTLEAFFAGIMTATYINNSDSLQNIPGSVQVLSSTSDATLNLENNVGNLYSMITAALSAYGVIVKVTLDPRAKTIDTIISKTNETPVKIEADLKNTVSKNFVTSDSFGAVNKLILINQDNEAEQAVYYLHTDGTISTTDADRISPVFCRTEYVSNADFAQAAESRAMQVLTPQQFKGLIELTYEKRDKLVKPETLSIGTSVEILKDKKTYRSILTGYELGENTVKLIFGIVRVDLLDKLYIESRNQSKTTASTGGTGSGDVLGPTNAVSGNIALFDGTTGKLLKDSGKQPKDGDVVGPLSAVSGNLALFDGTTGKLLKDSGKQPKDGDVVGPLSAVSGNLALFNGTTGKLIKDAGIAIGRTLWSGSLTSGSITVPDIDKYNLFLIKISENGAPMLGIRYGGAIRGITGYPVDADRTYFLNVNLGLSGTTVTLNRITRYYHTAGSTHGSSTTTATLVFIVGVI